MKTFQVRERINIKIIISITIHRNHYLCQDLIRRRIGQIQMAPMVAVILPIHFLIKAKPRQGAALKLRKN
jgi:hypothetical protein